jgi:hypothetical protein
MTNIYCYLYKIKYILDKYNKVRSNGGLLCMTNEKRTSNLMKETIQQISTNAHNPVLRFQRVEKPVLSLQE